MKIIALEVQPRETEIRAKDLRKMDLIPAVYYGRGVDNKSLQIDYQTFRKAYRDAGSNTVVELNIAGKEKINVLVHIVDRDPVTDLITHVDFVNVRMDEEITTKIPLEFTGTAMAVKDLGGILMSNLNEIEVKCLPKDLVQSIEVSVESLADFTEVIHVSDLIIPENVTVLHEPEEMVVTVVMPKEEVEEEPQLVEGEEGEEGEEGVEGEEGEEGKEGKEGEEGGEKKEGAAEGKGEKKEEGGK